MQGFCLGRPVFTFQNPVAPPCIVPCFHDKNAVAFMLYPTVDGSGDSQERAGGRGDPKDVADTGGGDSGVTWADTMDAADPDRPAEPGVSALQRTDED